MNLSGSVRITKSGVFLIIFILVILIYYISSSDTESTKYLKESRYDVNLRKLLIGSIQAAINGGIQVKLISTGIDFQIKSKGKTKEGANDPVTVADFNSHCVMKKGLQRFFPKLKIISEEDGTKNECPDSKLFDLDPTVLPQEINVPDELVNINDVAVWIDPLDATQEYTEKLFHFVTTMVCVTYKNEPIIGIIHNPFSNLTVWAWVDKSKSSNLENLKKKIDGRNVVVISRSHSGDAIELGKKIFGNNTETILAAGSGYKVLQVVYNNATAYLHSTAIKKWDICAGNAILNSVGGRMTNLLGENINYSSDNPLNDKGLLATISENHDNYISKIKHI